MAYTFGQASQKINQSPVDVEPALDASSTPTGYTFGQASKNINKAPTPPPPQVSTGRKTAEILAPSTTALSDYVRASSRLKSGEIDFMQKEREALISSKDPKAKTRINEIDTEIAKVIANADKTTGQKFGMAIGTGIEMSGVAELAALGGAVGRYGLRKVLGKAATEVAPKDVYTPFAGSKAANFITKATTIAPKTATEEAAYKASSLGSKAKVIAKDTAKLMPESVGFGYGYDVSMGLQEGEGTESLKPGAMTAIGAALPVAIGGTRLAKNAVVPSKAKAIDSLEQTYADLMSGTTPGKKKISKIEKKTEMMDKAGTTGKTPMRTLAEGGIIPKRNGPKLDTFDQAEEYRSGITYLKDANKQALEEVGLSSQLTKLDDLEASAIKYANSQRNIDSGRAPKMVKEIQKEFDYLREAYPEGVIPVGKVDEIKSARWDNVFGNKGLIDADVLKKDSEYAIAKAMQKHIEEIADVAGNPEVAQLNREIGDRLEAAKFLEDLNGKTIKGGRLLKYMTTGIGATLGNTVPGKIIGALGGNLAGEIIIATNISGPMKRLILRNLSKQDPAAYTKTIQWLSKQKLDKETRLLLPAPKTTMMGGTDIKGNKILPSGQKVAKPLEFLPQSKSPNNAQTTKAISKDAIMPASIPLTKNTVNKEIVDNLDHLSEKDKSVVEKWLNAKPDETERQLYKAAKDFDDYINAQYDQGIDRYNGIIKYIEGGAKNKDGVLPEMGVTSGKNSNGRKMREFVTIKNKDGKYIKKEASPLKFQKRGDTFIEELGFNDKEEAQDFIDNFRKTIEQRAISKKDLASFTNPALKNSYGAVAGIQVDEEGNVTFSPEMAAIGMIGGHLAPKMNLFKEAKGSTLANFLDIAKTIPNKTEAELTRLWENANGKAMKVKVEAPKPKVEAPKVEVKPFKAKEPRGGKDYTSKILERLPNKPTIKKYEIEQMLHSDDITAGEEKYVKSILKDLPDAFTTNEFKYKFKKDIIKPISESRSNYANYGLGNLNINYNNADTVLLRTPVEHGVGGHFGVKDELGHYRMFENPKEKGVAYVAEMQSDPFQRGLQFGDIKKSREELESILSSEQNLTPEVKKYTNEALDIIKQKEKDGVNNVGVLDDLRKEITRLQGSQYKRDINKKNFDNPDYTSESKETVKVLIDNYDYAINNSKEQITNMLRELKNTKDSPQIGQMLHLAKDNRYKKRLLEETLFDLKKKGYKEVNLPTPSTVAKVEWDTGNAEGSAPYEHANGDMVTNRDPDFDAGDTISFGGEDYTVVSADRYSIEVAPAKNVNSFDKDAFMRDELNYRLETAQSELNKLNPEGLDITPEMAQKWIDEEKYFDSLELEDTLKNVADTNNTVSWYGETLSMEELNTKVEQKIQDYLDDNGFDDLEGMYGRGNVFQDGDQIYTVDGSTETFSQPSEYESSYVDDLTSIDYDKSKMKDLEMSNTEEAVLTNYYDMQDNLKKIQKKSDITVTPVTKENDNGDPLTWINVKFGKNFKKSAFGLAGLAALGTANQKASADTDDIKFGEKDIKETKIRMGKYRYERTQEPTMFDGDALLKAIANNETGTATIKDPYSFNKWSDPKAGPLSKYGKDLGKYQITSARLKEKSKQFLGRVVTEKEFLSSPELQDKFIERQILWLKNQGLTPEQILAVHRHGWGDLSKKAIERALNERKSYVDKAVSFIKENKKI